MPPVSEGHLLSRFSGPHPPPDARPVLPDEDYFQLSGSVGRDGVNDRADVVRAQTLLAHGGYFDVTRTEGPTGWYGKPLELAIRDFQQDRGLARDGVMLPGGETVTALREAYGPAFAGRTLPALQQVDAHHDRRARGEPGLPDVWPGAGVQMQAHAWTAPVPSAATAMPAGGGKAGVELATMRRTDPVMPDPMKAPLIIGGGVIAGTAATKAVEEAARQPADQAGKAATQPDDVLATSRAALDEGVREAFGKVERNESENTRLTNRILVQECLKVIKAKMEPRNHYFEHFAGATQDGDIGPDLPEQALKDGVFAGGGGHSFPDVLFRDQKGNLVAINSATESAPGKYIGREIRSFDKLLKNLGRWVAKITGKKRPDEDEEQFRARASQVCDEAFDEFLQRELERVDKEQKAKAEEESVRPPSP